MKLSLTPKTLLKSSNLAFAVLLVLTVCGAYPSSNAYAKKRKPAKYGVIKIQTVPAGLPIEVDVHSFPTRRSSDLDRKSVV